jgi:hypothetical protein
LAEKGIKVRLKVYERGTNVEELQNSLPSCYRSVCNFFLINAKVTEEIFTTEHATKSQYMYLYFCSVMPLAFNGKNINCASPPLVRINDGTAARIHH